VTSAKPEGSGFAEASVLQDLARISCKIVGVVE